MKPWIKTKKNEIVKRKNDNWDEIIDKSKSFEEQIRFQKSKSFEEQIRFQKLESLKGYWPYKDFGGKELKSKYFKIELAYMSNDIDEKLFEQIFGHTLIILADKLINTTDKKQNQIIVKIIEINKDKLFKEEKVRPYNFVIQPQQRSDRL